MHNRLVGLLLEIAVPSTAELLAWPAIHLVQLLLGRADLDTCVDAVGSQGSGTVGIPLVKDCLLNLGNTTDKIVERIDVGLRSIGGEGEVVVLEVLTDTGKVDLAFDTNSLELLRVSFKS